MARVRHGVSCKFTTLRKDRGRLKQVSRSCAGDRFQARAAGSYPVVSRRQLREILPSRGRWLVAGAWLLSMVSPLSEKNISECQHQTSLKLTSGQCHGSSG